MAAYSHGMKGNGVKDLQTQLNKLGAGLTADGHFGPATKRAVLNFQKENGLAQDGIAGLATLSLIQARINEKIGEKVTAAFEAVAKLPEFKELEKLL